MPLELFLHPLSSYCQKAEIALYENTTPFEVRMLDGSEPVAGEFAALSPLGKFPILKDGDRVILETTIMIEFLDLHYPGATRFVPVDREAALEVRMLDRFFDNYVNAPVPWIVDAMMKPAGDDAPWRAMLGKAYAWLDRWLEGRVWAAAGQFSLADCAAAPALLYADWVHPISDDLATLKDYRTKLLARPSVVRAVDDARPFRHYLPFPAPKGRD